MFPSVSSFFGGQIENLPSSTFGVAPDTLIALFVTYFSTKMWSGSATLGFVVTPMWMQAKPALSRAVSPRLSLSGGLPDGFGNVDFSASAATDAASAASEAGDGSIIGPIIFVVFGVLAFNFASGFLRGASAALEEVAAEDEPRPAAKSFGWLHADMRMPLPSWEELQVACHRIGEHQGHTM